MSGLPLPPAGRGAGAGAAVLAGLAALALASGWTDGSALEADPGPRGPAAGGSGDSLVLEDDLGRTVRLAEPPGRLVSLVPAATEILFALGAGDRVVGRTRYGVHPPEARSVPSVGEGIRPSLEMVMERRPELVLIFAGPETRGTADRLSELGVASLALRHNTFADLRRNVLRLGRVTDRPGAARRLLERIGCQLGRVGGMTAGRPARRVYYEVWSDPPVTVGRGSYLDSLLRVAGARNVFGDLEAPSPRVGLEAVADRDPDLVLVPRRQGRDRGTRPARRPGWDAVAAVREERIRAVDGDLVHRLGPRIGEAARNLAAAVHPELADSLRDLELERCPAPRRSRPDSVSGPPGRRSPGR